MQKNRTTTIDTSREYWFVVKRRGYGWVPASWQGWVCLAVYVSTIVALVCMRQREISIEGNPDSGANLLVFGLPVLVLTVIFGAIVYKKGEKPVRRW